jgi:acetyltransferase-like isoleucine patch superfamily enzyme
MRSLFEYYIRFRASKAAYLRAQGARIGKNCFLYNHINAYSEPWLIEIGDDVTITAGVYLITHDGASRLFRRELRAANPVFGNGFGVVRILDNSFIGVNSIILPGVTIGPNAIVGAGSVVTKDVPEGLVYAGNPAGLVCTVAQYQQQYLDNLIPISARDRQALRSELTQWFWGEER